MSAVGHHTKRVIGKTLDNGYGTCFLMGSAAFLGAWYLPDIGRSDPIPTSIEQNAAAVQTIEQRFDRLETLRAQYTAASTRRAETYLNGQRAQMNEAAEDMQGLNRQINGVAQNILANAYLNPHLTNADYRNISRRLEDSNVTLNIRINGQTPYNFSNRQTDDEFYQSCRIDAHQSARPDLHPLQQARQVHQCMEEKGDAGGHAFVFLALGVALFFGRGMNDDKITRWANLPKKPNPLPRKSGN